MMSRYETRDKESHSQSQPKLHRTRSEEKIERLEILEQKMSDAIKALEKIGAQSVVSSSEPVKKKEKQKRGSNPWNEFCQQYYAKYGSRYSSYSDMMKSGDVSKAYSQQQSSLM